MKPIKYVESGRGVYIETGKFKGKFAVIVNAIDDKTVVIDGPSTGVPRHVTHINLLKLTKIVAPITHSSSSMHIKDVLKSHNIVDKWESSHFALKMKMKARFSNLNDFERFTLTQLKSKRSRMIRNEVKKIRNIVPSKRVKKGKIGTK